MRPEETGDVVLRARFDGRLASYKTFFDHEWAKGIRGLVAGTKMVAPVDALVFHWKSVANAHLMPWLITESLKNWARGFLLGHSPMAIRVIREVQRKLANELGNTISRRARTSVREVVERVATSALTVDEATRQAVARSTRSADIWSALVGQREFILSICGSQRLCYAGIYFAYENFVRQCTSLVTGKPEKGYQRDFDKQRRDMEARFGEELVRSCIADEQVKIARLVRNALVHGGGRVGEELRGIEHGILVEDGVLQIMAPDTSALFECLKSRALKLAERAVKLLAIN